MTGNTNDRLWKVLQRFTAPVRLDAAAEKANATRATALKYARLWEHAGLAVLEGAGAALRIQLTAPDTWKPPIITFDCGGGMAGCRGRSTVSPNDGKQDYFVTVNSCGDETVVTKRRKGVPGPAGVIEDAPEPPAAAPDGLATAVAHRYDRKEAMARVSYHLGQGVMAMLQAGRGLLEIKEHEAQGEFLAILGQLSIAPGLASRMMSAARKFLSEDGSVPAVIEAANGSITKVYELALMDDEAIEEIEAGTGPVTLDDVDRMGASELRKTLRAEREGCKREMSDRADAQARVVEAKNRRIADLQGRVDRNDEEMARLRSPGTWVPSKAEIHLHQEASQLLLRIAEARQAAGTLSGRLIYHNPEGDPDQDAVYGHHALEQAGELRDRIVAHLDHAADLLRAIPIPTADQETVDAGVDAMMADAGLPPMPPRPAPEES